MPEATALIPFPGDQIDASVSRRSLAGIAASLVTLPLGCAAPAFAKGQVERLYETRAQLMTADYPRWASETDSEEGEAALDAWNERVVALDASILETPAATLREIYFKAQFFADVEDDGLFADGALASIADDLKRLLNT